MIDPKLNTMLSQLEAAGGGVVGHVVRFDFTTKADLRKRRQGNYPERVELFEHICSHLGFRVEQTDYGQDSITFIIRKK